MWSPDLQEKQIEAGVTDDPRLLGWLAWNEAKGDYTTPLAGMRERSSVIQEKKKKFADRDIWDD